jgi:hypothetical protein
MVNSQNLKLKDKLKEYIIIVPIGWTLIKKCLDYRYIFLLILSTKEAKKLK